MTFEVVRLTKISIVAVHGLNPTGRDDHAWQTWTKTTAGGQDRIWLKEDLPRIAPRARILLYEYNSFPALTQTKSRFVYEGDKLLSCLENERYEVWLVEGIGTLFTYKLLTPLYSRPVIDPWYSWRTVWEASW